MAVHDRPAAFEGSDGFSYSVELMTDATGRDEESFGAYILFVKWARIGAQTPEGHLETEYIAHGSTEAEARNRIGALPLSEVKRLLDRLIEESQARRKQGTRRWYDAMRDESENDS
jgi:hypothetical protein